MASTDANEIDTSGVVGNPGAADDGTADQVHDLSNPPKPGEQETANAGAGGGGTVPAPPAQNQPDTEGAYSPLTTGEDLDHDVDAPLNDPADFTPVDTSVSGTTDTTLPGVANADPAYRAPNLQPGAGEVDTTWTDRLGAGPAPTTDSGQAVTGTTETGYFGAPAGTVTPRSDVGLTIDHTTPADLTHAGVIPGTVAVSKEGAPVDTAVTGESHVIHTASDFTLTHAPVTSAATALVVKKGATTLTKDTDYSATATGSGNTANFNIRALSGAAADGDTVTVDYHYNAPGATTALVEGTDFTVVFDGTGEDATAAILRVNTSAAVADGDTVDATYTTGDETYFTSNVPTERPDAPTGVTATGHRGYVTVAWTAPTGGAVVSGYRVENDADGVYFAPANATSFNFTQLTWEQPYKFRVAAQNNRGVGPYSAWTAAATATTPNAPWAGLDPKNTVNPIYNADGTIKPGTGGT